MSQLRDFQLPPLVTSAAGKTRTVGVEIEFGSLGAENAARVVKELFGGTLVRSDAHAFEVKESRLGDFAVKLDMRLGRYKGEPRGFFKEAEAQLAKFLGAAARLVVPFEIAAPPIPMDQLPLLEDLLSSLRAAGAKGTEASVFFAFGLQLNPEAPRLDSESITRIVKAFALMSPWLWKAIDPDALRRLLGFTEPYPARYVEKLVGTDYWPDFPTLIDDYLEANPSRNRDLDLLPLFAFLDGQRVRARLPDEKINPRPTFHYRLPDMLLDDPHWGLAREWNRWVAVERLAADADRLSSMCKAYLGQGGGYDRWAKRVAHLDFA